MEAALNSASCNLERSHCARDGFRKIVAIASRPGVIVYYKRAFLSRSGVRRVFNNVRDKELF